MGDLGLVEHTRGPGGRGTDVPSGLDPLGAPYTPIYQDWDETWIRSGAPHRGPLRGPHRFHDPRLVPEAGHPAFAEASTRAQDRLLAYRVHRWLIDFTTFIEDDLVTPVAEMVVGGMLPPLRSEAARMDARYLKIDEAAHSVFSILLARDIEAAAGVEAIEEELAVERKLREMFAKLSGMDRRIGALGATVATETLITAELGVASKSRGIFPSIAAFMRAHASDEARHRRLFAEWFQRVWPTLSRRGKQVMASCAGRTIVAYLGVDVDWLAEALARCGVGRDPVAIAHEVATDPRRRQEMRRSSRSTLSLLERAGAFEDPEIDELFQQLGLRDHARSPRLTPASTRPRRARPPRRAGPEAAGLRSGSPPRVAGRGR